MKTEFWMTGLTDRISYKEEIDFYDKRIRHYVPFEIREIKTQKTRNADNLKFTESENILKLLQLNDYLVLLDEKGKEFSSSEFARQVQKLFNKINSRIIFLSGGAYGFSQQLYQRANEKLSMSKMTFTHDMVRIIFLEQFYRAMTIIHNHPYQH